MICDDSDLARKSLYRSLNCLFELNYSFSENGREALAYISEHNVDILFLDLTMPVLDGYDVLQALPVSSYPTKVIIVSADVQTEAKVRCMALGATDFLDKPFQYDDIIHVLTKLNVPRKRNGQSQLLETELLSDYIDPHSKFLETANIALGRAAALVSDKIGIFIRLPLPAVGILEASELKMTITDALHSDNLHAVAQRFVGSGVNGEALVCMRGDGIGQIGHSLGFLPEESTLDEIVLNLSNLLISTFLNSLSDQVSVNFSLRQPVTLKNSYAEKTIIQEINEGAFAVEFTYRAENIDFECEVLLFFDSQSVDVIYRLMDTL